MLRRYLESESSLGFVGYSPTPGVVGGALSLQETSEFFNGDTRLTNDGTKRSFGYFFVPRDSKPTMRRIFVSQDDVTASLMINTIAGFREGPAKLVSRNQG